jgi:hypothetical protein
MKRKLLIVSVFFLSLLVSCDNVSTNQKSESKIKTNSSPKLKSLSYKMKSGNLFTSNSADSDFENDMGKALNLFISNANYIDLYDPTKVESYKNAFVDFMFEVDTGFLEFANVKLGNLELKDENSYWIDPIDSLSTGETGIDIGGCFDDSTGFYTDVHIYSWFQEFEDDFPSEFSEGATPAFSAEYNGTTIGKTLTAIPAVVNGFQNLTTDSEVDLNNDFKVEFKSELPTGTFVGIQVLPVFENGEDSLGGVFYSYYNLYLETELTESATSVTFTAEMLKDIKDNIDDASKVIADVFLFSFTKHDEIQIDTEGKKANVYLNISSAVSVHLKK